MSYPDPRYLWFRFKLDFDDIGNYVKFFDVKLKEQQSDFAERVKKLARNSDKLEEDERELLEGAYISEDYDLNSVFPTYLIHSIFNTAYSVFEKYMNEICFLCEGKMSTRVKLKGLKGTGIERAKSFLSKEVCIDTLFNSQDWSDIKEYSDLRNILIHTLGELDMSQKSHRKVYKFCSSHPNIYLNPDDPEAEKVDVRLSLEIMEEALLCYMAFLGNLHKEASNKING